MSFRLCPICLLSVHRPDKIEGSEFSSISGKYCTCCNFIVLITFMPFFHSHASIFCNVKSIDCDMYLVFFSLEAFCFDQKKCGPSEWFDLLLFLLFLPTS